MATEQPPELAALPKSETHRLIDFDQVKIYELPSFPPFPPQVILQVSGTKPYVNMDVRLVPLTYIKRPEYWGIEVVGSLGGVGLPVQAPYVVFLWPTPLGTRGIEVIGASRSEKHDLTYPTDPS